MRKIFLFIGLVSFVNAKAQDRVFTYTYQSGVLNKGQKEIEVWSTLLGGRENFYRELKHRTEFEVGLGGKLQTSFYLNYGYNKAIEEQNGIQVLSSSAEYSFSNEWKLKLSDPVANRLGSALYFEFTLAPAETEIEGKIIIDRKAGNFLNALNITGEFETEKEFLQSGTKINPVNTSEFIFELNYGISYNLRNKLNIGLEALSQNPINNKSWESSVLYLGPCISYSIDGFWINLTSMPQIYDFVGRGLQLTEHERLRMRLIFSYVF